MSTITALLDKRAEELPHREVVRAAHQDIRWSYSDLQRHSTALALGLSELGFRQGDVLASWLPNDSEQVVALFAAARLGAVLAPLDMEIKSAQELTDVMTSTGCRGVLYGPAIRTDGNGVMNSLFPQFETATDTVAIKDKRFPNLRHVITSEWDPVNHGILNFRNIMMYDACVRDAVARTKPMLNADTPVCQPVTAIPGMRPSIGAALTHKQLLEHAAAAVSKVGITDADKLCLSSPSPLGIPVGSVAACQTNAPLVLVSSDTDDELVQQVAAVEGVTKVVQSL